MKFFADLFLKSNLKGYSEFTSFFINELINQYEIDTIIDKDIFELMLHCKPEYLKLVYSDAEGYIFQQSNDKYYVVHINEDGKYIHSTKDDEIFKRYQLLKQLGDI